MSNVVVSQLIQPAIQPNSYGRNGQIAAGNAMASLCRGVNQCLRWRTKELYSSPGDYDGINASAGAGPTTRWRTYVHTGPYVTTMRWFMTLARPSSGSTGSPKASIAVTTTAGAAVASADANYGYGSTTTTLESMAEFTGTLTVSADTDYLITFTVADNGRLVNALLCEESIAPTTANGYVADLYTSLTPIQDDARLAIQTALYALHRRGAAVVFDAHLDAHSSIASATDTNIIDGSSTAVAASSPGWTLDMRYKARLKDAAVGVSCTFAAYGSMAAGTNGSVKIKDSAGATLATITGFTTTPSWRTATVTFPATKAKYDVTYSTTASTFTLNSVAVFEYAA